MNILVTGGAGYIGSHTVKELIKKGFNVIIFDNLSTGKKELIKSNNFYLGDLQEINSLNRAFEENRIDGVIHFASLSIVEESYKFPERYYRENILNALNLLDAMKKHGVKKIIFSSSAGVYGEPQYLPIDENHPINPINPYGETKYVIEKILYRYFINYNVSFISLRYFNAAGADLDGELGELHDPETHLIPNILLSIIGKNKKFELFGDDFPTKDGTAIRDYIHVTDLSNAHVLALEKLFSNDDYHILNLGTGIGYSNREIINCAERITGKKIEVEIKSRRRGDPHTLIASNKKITEMLGWKPRNSDIETIIQTAWEWIRKHYI
ncbi:MAG: UDP-glucose 4-epimerase GalE [Acidobacteriota bacterium]